MITAEVAVVGAGVIGCSIAWHLAAAGVRDVVVIDANDAIASGSTARATGGFRVQFGSRINVQLSLLSRRKLLAFEEEVGAACGYDPAGYLFLADDPVQMEQLAAIRELLISHDVDQMSLIGADDARRLNPAVSLDGIVGGSYCSIDGFIRPGRIAAGYADAARRVGVRFLLSTRVESALKNNSRIGALRTSGGDIAARAVVNAAGAWARPLSQLLGSDVAVEPLRRFVAPTFPTDVLPSSMPMTIFLADGFHLRVRDDRVLLLRPDHAQAGVDTAVDATWLDELEQSKNERVPALKEVPIDRAASWGGLYEISPDHHAIIGRDILMENVWLANGSSGHGVMHAPAIGQIVADLIVGRTPPIDVTSLRPSRFDEDQPVAGIDLL